jgi:hypothetical protein
MQHVCHAAVDGSELAAEGAAALPFDCDARGIVDRAGLLASLCDGGRHRFGSEAAEGARCVRIVVDEEPPGVSGRSPAHRGRIAVPAGGLRVGRTEHVAADDLRGREPAIAGDRIVLPPGDYDLDVYEFEHDPARVDGSVLGARQGALPTSRMRSAEPLLYVGLTLLIALGTVAALAAMLALAGSLVAKLVQWSVDSPLVRQGWRAMPWLLVVACGGVAAAWCGVVLGRRVPRRPADVCGNAADASRRTARPGLVLALRRRDQGSAR